MSDRFAVLRPATLDELLDVLADESSDQRMIAGGTAVSIMLKRGLIAPDVVISLRGLPGLRSVAHDGGATHIGALVTLRELELDAKVARRHPAIPETMAKVANVRVRNAATVGGNICEADYASDPPALLIALGASVRLVSRQGERTVPLDGFFRAFYETAIEPNEVLVELLVPDPAPTARTIYLKYVSRSAEDRPCVGVAASLALDRASGACTALRVVVGGAAETPQRLPEVEAIAVGKPLTRDVVEAVADGYSAAIDPVEDVRGSAWYRREMIRVFVRRAIEAAVAAPGAPG
jgi:carbon-monoxide dehydrogenase medium subunit